MIVNSDYLDDLEVSIVMGCPYSWLVYSGKPHLEMDEN